MPLCGASGRMWAFGRTMRDVGAGQPGIDAGVRRHQLDQAEIVLVGDIEQRVVVLVTIVRMPPITSPARGGQSGERRRRTENGDNRQRSTGLQRRTQEWFHVRLLCWTAYFASATTFAGEAERAGGSMIIGARAGSNVFKTCTGSALVNR